MDWQKMEEMYPIPPEPDPMEGWKCICKPGAYEGGLWNIEEDGYIVHLVGDDGPIDVGMSFPTYTWRISSDKLPYAMESKQKFNDRDECRDEALKALRDIKRNQ